MDKQGSPIAAFLSLLRYLDQRSWSTLVGTGSLLWMAAIAWFATISVQREPFAMGTLADLDAAMKRDAVWDFLALVAISFASAGSALFAFEVYRTIRNLMHRR